ncbi:MAG: energy transducer TonB [Acidobacteriia bacterium]|nr:energy transducer TonB [Terriglobia bacterium]
MFDEVLVCNSAWANRGHRAWTTLASFAMQALAVSLLLLLPLIYPQGLPRLALTEYLIAPVAPAGAPPAPEVRLRPANPAASNMIGHTLVAPAQIPTAIVQLDEDTVPPAPEVPAGYWVPGGTGPTGTRNPVLDSIGNGLHSIAPPPAPAALPPRLSHAMEANIVHRVQPDYPILARQARIQGAVVLSAVISRDGTIENLQVLSGHPMLVRAAMEAVRQWRYRPYLLNGEAVEVETQITVNFVLAGG